jgi:hypothetical protein
VTDRLTPAADPEPAAEAVEPAPLVVPASTAPAEDGKAAGESAEAARDSPGPAAAVAGAG